MLIIDFAVVRSNTFNDNKKISTSSLTNATANIISRFYADRTTSIFISLLNMTNVFLGGSMTQVMNWNARRIFAVWLLSSLILRNAYQGSLFNFLQSQVRQQPVDTIAKIIEFNYSLYVTKATSDVLIERTPKLRTQLSWPLYNKFNLSSATKYVNIPCFSIYFNKTQNPAFKSTAAIIQPIFIC